MNLVFTCFSLIYYCRHGPIILSDSAGSNNSKLYRHNSLIREILKKNLINYQILLNDKKNPFISSLVVVNKSRSRDYRAIGQSQSGPCLIMPYWSDPIS